MDTQFKKLIPSIYLKDCKAVKSFSDNESAGGDPAALAAAYDNGFTDALIIFDLSVFCLTKQRSLRVLHAS